MVFDVYGTNQRIYASNQIFLFFHLKKKKKPYCKENESMLSIPNITHCLKLLELFVRGSLVPSISLKVDHFNEICTVY